METGRRSDKRVGRSMGRRPAAEEISQQDEDETMFELKKISAESIPAALEKAMRYRLLNEPMEAESICLDVLALEPENQQAVVMLILSLTDQFDRQLGERVRRAQALLDRIEDEFERLYYEGIIYERQAKSHVRRANPRSGHIAYDFLRRAMDTYAEADEKSPPDNDDAVLRWNACVRIIEAFPEIEPATDAPMRPISLE